MLNFRYASACLLTGALCCTSVLAGEGADLNDTDARINYAIGYQVGGDFKRQAVEINTDMVLQGLRDAQSDGEALMTPAEMSSALAGLQSRVGRNQPAPVAPARGEFDQVADDQQFLVDNARRTGVTTTASGLQYEVLSPGSGKHPQATDWVTVNYRGALIDGSEFDSSDRNGGPASFRVDGVIPGWTEALQLMQEGAEWRLFIPTKLAYPHSGPLEHKTLIFDVQLLSVSDKPPAGAEAAQP